ncbi:hypothetical protein LEMA_P023080.1 [Plenodomus lingam JN3]|uniref:Acireductone dioxygenase n=1 Tax=Leptosphaeria maculans (strain JN3 / isolate v23.1.3 / race Av1-4-5-6-7-8) TaxID=985895 RepID=E5ABY7_LEPMJ|nr:hypothetical protein LEMA_P023080.1 [Plenodomus lingam JN3]CBY01178.1 hypothetical protein LEMA_P023080.1 [Plenodomus lingam JN3]
MKAYWFDNLPGDQREPHDSGRNVDPDYLAKLGVIYHHVPEVAGVDAIATSRNYKNRDEITVSPEKMGDIYEEKVKTFFHEHLHEDEEIRYILDGAGYFDVRSEGDDWVRIWLEKGDLIILPSGIYHRFTTDEQNYTKAMRLFKDEPKWTPLNRGNETDENPYRKEYLKAMQVDIFWPSLSRMNVSVALLSLFRADKPRNLPLLKPLHGVGDHQNTLSIIHNSKSPSLNNVRHQSSGQLLTMEPQKKVEHLRPEPRRRAPPKSSASILGHLIAHAKRGHDDFISPELMEDNRRKNEEYERSHKRPRVPPSLPSLQTLQRMRNTLRDSVASKGDSYRPDYRKTPDDPHHAQKTQRQKSSYTETPPRHTPAAYLANLFASDRSTRVNCQVSLCEHEYYAIDWESSDSDNRKGSWIAHFRHYWDYPSSRDDHKKCQPPNIQSRCNVLAERIIAKSMEKEDRKSLGRDKRNGAVTRPSFERVHREVRIMYSHLFRGNAEDVIEKKEEAARKKHDLFSQREILAEKTQRQAHAERQRKELAKGLAIEDSVKEPSNKRTRMDDGDTARYPKEAPKKKQKISVPEDRFKPTTKEEREKRVIQMKKSIQAQHTLRIANIREKKKAVSSKLVPVDPGSNEDKHAPTKVSAPQIPKPQGPKKKELTPEERKILKRMQRAEAEEANAYTSNNIVEPKQQPEDKLDEEAHILSQLTDQAKKDILLAPATSKTDQLCPYTSGTEVCG